MTTVYGCYDTQTHDIIFNNGGQCTNMHGCFVTSGEHSGQIAVTVATDYCTDTYYGCVFYNEGTGKWSFAVEIPEECCLNPNPCSHCYDSQLDTPYNLTVQFADFPANGITGVNWSGTLEYFKVDLTALIGQFIVLQQTDIPCNWSNNGYRWLHGLEPVDGTFGTIYRIHSFNNPMDRCNGGYTLQTPPESYALNQMVMEATRSATRVTMDCYFRSMITPPNVYSPWFYLYAVYQDNPILNGCVTTSLSGVSICRDFTFDITDGDISEDL